MKISILKTYRFVVKVLNKYRWGLVPFYLISLILIFVFNWWFLGVSYEFKVWYPNTGVIIWSLKQLFLLVFSLSFILVILVLIIESFKINWIRYVYLNFSLFIFYVLFSLGLGEEHPFSEYPMYDTIFKDAKIYYYTDQYDEMIPTMILTNTPSQFIDKLYKVYCDVEGVEFNIIKNDNDMKEKLGSFILQNTIDTNTINELNVTFLKLHVVECNINPARCDTTLIISRKYE